MLATVLCKLSVTRRMTGKVILLIVRGLATFASLLSLTLQNLPLAPCRSSTRIFPLYIMLLVVLEPRERAPPLQDRRRLKPTLRATE